MVNLRIPAKQTHAPFLQRQRQAEIAVIREFGGWHRDDSVERVGGTGTGHAQASKQGQALWPVVGIVKRSFLAIRWVAMR